MLSSSTLTGASSQLILSQHPSRSIQQQQQQQQRILAEDEPIRNAPVQVPIRSLLMSNQALVLRSQLRSRTSDGETSASKQSDGDKVDQMELICQASRPHSWHWNELDKSHVCIVGKDKLEVCFHPRSSESSAAIRGSEPLKRNGNYYYWEVKVFEKAYGTSVMFGVCTKNQPLHSNEYCNLVGLDQTGWSLSHKGLIWNNNKCTQFMRPFPVNQSVTLGILLNTMRGELSYFMDGKCVGVAFKGLNDFDDELYPVIGSTAKCTRMRLMRSYCGYISLLERSCFTLLKNAPNRLELLDNLYQNRVPKQLINYIVDSAQIVANNDNSLETNNRCTATATYESRLISIPASDSMETDQHSMD